MGITSGRKCLVAEFAEIFKIPFLHPEKVAACGNKCCCPLTLTVKSKGMIMALLPRPLDSTLKSVRCDFVVDFSKR